MTGRNPREHLLEVALEIDDLCRKRKVVILAESLCSLSGSRNDGTFEEIEDLEWPLTRLQRIRFKRELVEGAW